MSDPLPKGWYPEKGNPAEMRYWDGFAWSKVTRPAHLVSGAVSTAAVATPYVPSLPPASVGTPAPASAPAATTPDDPPAILDDDGVAFRAAAERTAAAVAAAAGLTAADVPVAVSPVDTPLDDMFATGPTGAVDPTTLPPPEVPLPPETVLTTAPPVVMLPPPPVGVGDTALPPAQLSDIPPPNSVAIALPPPTVGMPPPPTTPAIPLPPPITGGVPTAVAGVGGPPMTPPPAPPAAPGTPHYPMNEIPFREHRPGGHATTVQRLIRTWVLYIISTFVIGLVLALLVSSVRLTNNVVGFWLLVDGLVILAGVTLGVLLLVFTLLWVYDCAQNAALFQPANPQTFSPVLQVVGWLIPVANLVLPAFGLRETWMRSERPGIARSRWGEYVGQWWACLTGQAIAVALAYVIRLVALASTLRQIRKVELGQTVGAYHSPHLALLVADLFSLVSVVLFFLAIASFSRMVTALSRLQNERIHDLRKNTPDPVTGQTRSPLEQLGIYKA